ncbi:hypothetical protein BCR33DRAFT_417701 [Rhizoclosmatium globosum]|uniref:Transcription factor domain-containing protein n=1 Tax=Rhizoclosmatium globosum TaxID=329046 RepID=A0A1Y2BYD6_9FUNG|nr:hypothetical protein BCR33DRAFT_417701 [Rhizoclosmatium globosum]|eukprot:ORY39085.1 hypothetical protein BCR33DRAFT_417701 [Rhizoclosmatium globosum]
MQHQCTQCHLCKSRSSARPCSFCDSLSNPTKVDTQSQLLLSEWLMKTPSYLPLFPSTPPQLSASFKQNGVLFQPLYLQNTLSTYEIKEESIGPLDIEDRDLLPTLEDFELVYNDLTRNGTIWPPSMFSFDAESFLVNFYSAEPAFRLIQCATSAFYAFPPKPETVQLSYYKRAKKAIDRIATRKPTFQSVQAYYAIYGFAYDKGQPLVALEFLQKAMSAMIELRMDFDPDNSPWLLPLNLTSRQKEERRRTFWVIYRQAVYEKAVSFTEMRILIDITAMKTASNIIGHELESSAVELALKWDAMILNQIALIKINTPLCVIFLLLCRQNYS